MRPGWGPIVHHAVCRHRVEVQVSPARAQLLFQDEADADPINAQTRFEATVYNSDRGVAWDVVSPAGDPGAGTIDATGLYRAPRFAGRTSGMTDIVVATSRADPLRKAYAWVTVVGKGPAQAEAPTIEVRPFRAAIFRDTPPARAYIDATNRRRSFRAYVGHASPTVAWYVNHALQAPQPGVPDSTWFVYEAGATSGPGDRIITARLVSVSPPIEDSALLTLRDYLWPWV